MAKKAAKQTQRRRVILLWFFIMSVFITELLVYTWSRLQCTLIGYDISELSSRQSELTAVQKNLKVELARLKSPQRISEMTKARLNLAAPLPEQIITIP